MSIHVITCTKCEKSGPIPFKTSVDHQRRTCSCCHKSERSTIDFYFCSFECMSEWYRENEVLEKGFPCLHCANSPFLQQNCYVCNNTRRITHCEHKEKRPSKVDFNPELVSGSVRIAKEIEEAGGIDAYMKQHTELNAKSKEDNA